jgi:hypothetical protein
MRISPWQAGKVMAVCYAIMGLIFASPFAMFSASLPTGDGMPFAGVGFAIALPIMYGIGGLIFVPLACLIFNFAAKLVGGLELEVHESAS